jgi:hypothetical protein
MDIRSRQRLVWENKVAKGFNTTDVPPATVDDSSTLIEHGG